MTIIEQIQLFVEKKVPLLLSGPPGIGKSAYVAQVAKKLGIQMTDLRLAQLDPVDLRGVPVPNMAERLAVWLTPEYLPREGRGILFLDEIDKAAPSVKNAALQLVLDRRIGSYVLPEGWAVIAAGNREEDNCFSIPLGSALYNRFAHIDVAVDPAQWLSWASSADLDSRIVGFITKFPARLHIPSEDAKAFPTPRSWEMLSKLISGTQDEEAFALAPTCIGAGAASEFVKFVRSLKGSLEIEKFFTNPMRIKDVDSSTRRELLLQMNVTKHGAVPILSILAAAQQISPEAPLIYLNSLSQVDREILHKANTTKALDLMFLIIK